MHARLLLGAMALFVLAVPAEAQVRLRVGAGAVASSSLLADSIAQDVFTVRPRVAPAVAIQVDGMLDSLYRVGARVSFASSTLLRITQTDSGSVTAPIVNVTVWEPTVRIGRAWDRVEVGLRAGIQVYGASESTSIFRDGGRVTPTVGADIALAGPRILGATVGVEADWSIARFTTTTLALSGFSGEQTVHRVALRMTVTGGPGAR